MHYMNVMRVTKQSFDGSGDREMGPEASGKCGRFWTRRVGSLVGGVPDRSRNIWPGHPT